jgi:hypothetical protein
MQRQNEVYAAEAQRQTAQQKVAGFIEATAAVDPAKAQAAVKLLSDFTDIARTRPDQFIDFAKVTLGLNAPAATPTPTQAQPAEDTGRLAAKARAATPRSAGGTPPTHRKPPSYNSTKDAVAAAIDLAMRGKA